MTLGGCSGGSGDDATKQPTAQATATSGVTSSTAATASAGTTDGTQTATSATGGESTDSTRSVEGIWLAMEDGNKVQLVLGKGKAGLTSTHLCGGGYTEHDGVSIVLTCMDGDKERTSGHGVLGADGKTLIVKWSNGPTDTFSRTGLPSS